MEDPRRTKLAKSTQETGEKETGDRGDRRQETRKLNPKSKTEEAVLEFTQGHVRGQRSVVSGQLES